MTDNPDRGYDAHLKVIDFDELGDRGPTGKDVVFGWMGSDPTLSQEERDAFEALSEEAHDRFDIDEFPHQETIARIWVDGDELEQVVWTGDIK